METALEVLVGEIFKVVISGISFSFKFLNIIVWAIAGALLIPIIFIAGNIYPLWEKWTESLGL